MPGLVQSLEKARLLSSNSKLHGYGFVKWAFIDYMMFNFFSTNPLKIISCECFNFDSNVSLWKHTLDSDSAQEI